MKTFEIFAGITPERNPVHVGVTRLICNQLTLNATLGITTSDFHLVSDSRYLQRYLDQVGNLEKKIIYLSANEHVEEKIDGNISLVRNLGRNGVSFSINSGMYHGASTLHFALQFAGALGASEVIVHSGEYQYGTLIRRTKGESSVLPDPFIGSSLVNIAQAVVALRERGITVKTSK